MQAIILVGGLGLRLKSCLDNIPKALAEINGKPFLFWMFDYLKKQGITKIILATGHMSNKIESLIGNNWDGIEIIYSIESKPLGTGGAIKKALAQIDPKKGVFVFNGDTWLTIDLQSFAEAVKIADSKIGVALAKVNNSSRYGHVNLKDDYIVKFLEKKMSSPGYINAGLYFLAKPFEISMPEFSRFSFEDSVLIAESSNSKLFGYKNTSNFIDIGIPEDYKRAQKECLKWLF